ncbi:uncharacterized protein LOC121408310 isoform X1 [Lytechinus variegatus]|uniref:uncharacterized protein LOC121408310 isoform X1 n=1 Tax=Lytechinus variegatus TaxID=7654 RepID=UPI001BB17D0E|nr:uncharacterized protein LOC121408310 isoform X1 [Lytechinus variegatus]XP_041455661.1 uncharacterized protein LOC121408310 isoform X1 [Lytechinus variegatus]
MASYRNHPVPQGMNTQYGMQSPNDNNQFDWMMDQLMEGQGGEGGGPGDNLLHMILEEDEGEHSRNEGFETDTDGGPVHAGYVTSEDEYKTQSVVRPMSHDQSGDQSQGSTPRKGRKKRLIDPFGELPPIKDILETDDLDEFGETKKRKKKQRVKRFKCTQFTEPDKQLAWTIFRTADRDNDGKLSRKEFGTIMNSPRLDLEVSKDDVTKLMKDICHKRDNIKDSPMTFDEFLPFGVHLLKFFYSKKDVNSENHWVVLDKGPKSGVIYFNKETGEACTTRPLDYDAWHFQEPDLFERSLMDLFEIADMNNDGKININDFIRIINSVNYGLQLTDEDLDQINNHFVNEAGRKINMPYAFFVPMAKRLIVTIYRARDPYPHEWCHLYTGNVGSFWFNKRTGESSRVPPKKYITEQQHRLVDRELEMELLTKSAEDLASTRSELEKERKRRQDLEKKLSTVSRENSSNASALEKTTKTLEKTKTENEMRGKQIEHLEREIEKLNTKMKGLESRAAEGDKAEQNLESVRDMLKVTQSTVREKDFDLRQLKSKLDETNKMLGETKENVEMLEAKVADLHHQLRVEIKRNQQMEEEMKVIPLLKKDLSETDERVAAVQSVLDEKKTQLTHARYILRDNKQTIKNLEDEIDRLVAVETEMEHAKCEVDTLKKLLDGKDRLVIKQAQQIANATGNRKSMESLNYTLRTCSDPSCPLYQNPKKTQGMQTNGHHKSAPRQGASPEDISDEGEEYSFYPKRKSPTKAIDTSKKSFLRFLENDGNHDDMPTVYDLYEPNGVYSPQDKRSGSPRSHQRVRPKSCVARIQRRDKSALPTGTRLYEDDFMVAQFVHVGDRVRVKKNASKIISMKPSDFMTGIVKFVGKIDKDHIDHHIYVGLRLDEPTGDTDGIINGKRYFHANKRHGKIVKITDIFLVLNAKTATYQRINELVRELRHKTGTTKTYRDGEPELIEIP